MSDGPTTTNDSAIVAAASTASNDDNKGDVSMGELWDTLLDEFTNMGRALACPLCLSTYKDAVILPCVHAYCRHCLKEALNTSQPRCPTCMVKASRRSVAPAPTLNKLAKAYKLALRHFGLAPVRFDPSYNAMTQIDPRDADPNSFGQLEVANVSYHESSPSARRKSNEILASHTQLMVSKTWQRVLNEREQEEEAAAHSARLSAKVKVPSNIPTFRTKHKWYQEQQQAVCQSHERMLLDSLRRKKEKPPSPHLNLSMLQENYIEEGLDRELANRQMEEDEEEWEQEIFKEEKKRRQSESKDAPKDDERVEKVEETKEEDSKPMVDSNPTSADTQDFFTPREIDSQGSAVAPSQRTMGLAQSLVDMSVAQANTTTTSNRVGENPQKEERPLLSMAESFDTAPSQEGGPPSGALKDGKEELEERKLSPAKKNPSTAASSNNKPTAATVQERTPLQSNRGSHMEWETTHSSDQNNTVGGFRVGALVKVQDRTWSGINKPGGIARITKVVDASSFNVEYILGGREKNVDALFLSLPPEEMDWVDATDDEPTATKTKRGRKSKRISTRVQFKEEAEAALPPDLMEQLAKEGFDINPIASSKSDAFTKSSRGRTVRINPAPTVILGTKRSRSESQGRRRPPKPAAERIKSEGQARPPKPPKREATKPRGRTVAAKKKKKPPVLQLQAAAQQEEKDEQARNKQPAGAAANKKKPAAKKTSICKRRKTVVSKREQLPPSASTVELCSLANGHYRQRIQEDMDNNSICIITSGLPENDKAALKSLCKAMKANGGVHIKQSESFHPEKTTLCLLAASPSRDDSCNLVAQSRTMKAMLCALHGVPLVSSSWIQACQHNNCQVTMPSDSMWIRSLPVKTPTDKGRGVADYGVAKMAMQTSILGIHRVFPNFTAHLCGTFSRPPKADVQQLLREAGAELSLQNQSTISFLQKMEAGSSIVFICDDACGSLNQSLNLQIETTRKEYKAKEIFVVNPQWLFDSVSAGSALPMAAYPPAKKNGQPLTLWKALQS